MGMGTETYGRYNGNPRLWCSSFTIQWQLMSHSEFVWTYVHMFGYAHGRARLYWDWYLRTYYNTAYRQLCPRTGEVLFWVMVFKGWRYRPPVDEVGESD